MRTVEIQRRFDMTAQEVEAARQRFSGKFGAQPGRWHKRNGVMVHEYTGEMIHTPNLVVNEGLNHALETVINAGTPITVWFHTGYVDNITPLATHTAAVPGVTEIDTADVAEAVRETFNANAASGQSIDNVAGPVSQYTADQTFTMFGMMLIGGGTSAFGNLAGTLWASNLLAPSRPMVALDTLDMVYTFPATAT
jgi:hypothetical protein